MAHAMKLTAGMCKNGLDDLHDCAFDLFDTNNDTQITEAEIEARIPTLHESTIQFIKTSFALMNGSIANYMQYPVDEIATTVIQYCDADEDGVLTLNDFEHENATCLHDFDQNKCIHCILNGYETNYSMMMKSVDEAKKRRQIKR